MTIYTVRHGVAFKVFPENGCFFRGGIVKQGAEIYIYIDLKHIFIFIDVYIY